MIYIDYYEFANNILQITCSEEKVISVRYVKKKNDDVKINEMTKIVVRQFDDFFNKKSNCFNLPLDISYLSDFQQDVLITLKDEINECITYGDLARLSGHPGAARAVGTVMSNNPYAIIIPCHLVVAANDIGSYTGASLNTKELLISLSLT